MFKDVLQHMDLTLLTRTGLLIFFICFIAIVIFAITRPKEQVRQWARLPLSSGEEPGNEEERS